MQKSFSFIYDYVLVLAMVTLILFTVPNVGLWLEFVLEDVPDNTENFFFNLLLSSAYASKGLFCFLHHSTSKEAGNAQGVGSKTQSALLIPTVHRVPHIIQDHAYQ